jgi:hypothetical protein
MAVGKKTDAEVAALKTEVEMLRAEVAALKAVPWWQQPGGGVAYWPLPEPQCTCGTSVQCQKHALPQWTTVCLPPRNVCGAAAGVAQTQFMNTAGANPVRFEAPLSTAAGCAPPFILPV